METRGRRGKRILLEQVASIVPEDRISNLPVDIVHDIISLLPARAACRLSVMSKKWGSFYDTLRCINFELGEFRDERGMMLLSSIHEFMTKYLSVQNPLGLHRVKVSTNFLFHPRFLYHIGKCFNLAIQGRIQELDLRFWHTHDTHGFRSICFTLPSRFFQSKLLLTVLKLEGCRVSETQILGFPLLKILSLNDIHISNDTLLNMVCGCPRLESLIMESCHELGKVSIINHSLRTLVMKYCHGVSSFYIDVPLLHTFEFDASSKKYYLCDFALDFHFETPEDVIFGNMRVLYLSNMLLKVENLQHLFNIFPSVNDMEMKHCCIIDGNQAAPANAKKLAVVDVLFPKLVEGFASSVEFLYCHNSIQYFQFHNFIPSRNVEFARLTSLTLRGFFILSDGALEHLISHCPVLENLNLQNCFRLRELKIASRVLKTLTLEANDHQENNEIKAVDIVAPNLFSFEYVGPFIKFSRIIVSEKLICRLRFGTFSKNGAEPQLLELRDIVKKFKEASKLIMATSSTEIILTTEGAGQVPSWFSWAHFKLRLNRSNLCYLDIRTLLSSSRCCTSLSIELPASSIHLKFEDPTQLEKLNLHVGPAHDCIRDHLVEAHFNEFDVNIHVLRLVEYMLLKAEHLKMLVIRKKASARDWDVPAVMDIIKNIPYVSRDCQIRVLSL